jgi:hypothetical protein
MKREDVVVGTLSTAKKVVEQPKVDQYGLD